MSPYTQRHPTKADNMTFHILVQFDVPSDKREAFERAALLNADSVNKEPGTLTFEVIDRKSVV
jgi:quinol monooxygenase YgiN